MASASLSYLFKVSYDPFHSNMASSRHDWVVPYLSLVSRGAAVYNGSVTIKHRPVLVITMSREALVLFLTKHCFRLQWLHYYRYVHKLQISHWKLEIQLRRSMFCHVNNTRWNTEYVGLRASDIVPRVMLVKAKGSGAALCNVTTLMDHIWWTAMIAPIICRGISVIARYTHP